MKKKTPRKRKDTVEQRLSSPLWLSVSGTCGLNVYEQFNSSLGGVYKKPFPCRHCERSYKNKSSLNRHLQYECGKQKQFTCPICQRRLIQKSSLHKHIIAVHGI
ncbi:hypothetical protein KM043_007692 [Ampulex compressa]|nr:hypothetical protein KM043_007692 [Ampulex compressa]